MMKFSVLLIPVALIFSVTCAATSKIRDTNDNSKIFTRTIRMNNVTSTRPDDLRCTYIKADPTRRQYIGMLGYVPHATMEKAHHMVLYGCKKPAHILTDDTDWYCGPDSVGICERAADHSYSENSLYAWALNADAFDFPEGVGYRIGGDTDYQYLIMQLHYKSGNQVDNSGLTVKLTYEEMPYQVGYYILGNYGFIPPQIEEYHMESGCEVNLPYEIVPLTYRTHAHNLGKVISGYLIKSDGSVYELGRMSPKQPQLYYDVTTKDTIVDSNDFLISRCTMNSMTRNSITNIGPTNKDEMCNFYIMYYTNYPNNIRNALCFRDTQTFSWADNFVLPSNVTEMASSLKGVKLLRPDYEMAMEMHDHE